jgi:hypothetical protein
MSATSLTLLLAKAEPPKKLSLLMFLGLWFALIGDLWILKGLSNKRRDH